MTASATGDSMRHNGFSAHAAPTNTAVAPPTAAHACAGDNRPAGSSRVRVRGFFASSSLSAMRLKPIATKRAAVKAMTTRARRPPVTGYRNDAAITPSSAKGNAKMVCGSRTKLMYRTSRDSPEIVWASRLVSPTPLELKPQFLPHRVDFRLRRLVHHDLVGPLA